MSARFEYVASVIAIAISLKFGVFMDGIMQTKYLFASLLTIFGAPAMVALWRNSANRNKAVSDNG